MLRCFIVITAKPANWKTVVVDVLDPVLQELVVPMFLYSATSLYQLRIHSLPGCAWVKIGEVADKIFRHSSGAAQIPFPNRVQYASRNLVGQDRQTAINCKEISMAWLHDKTEK